MLQTFNQIVLALAERVAYGSVIHSNQVTVSGVARHISTGVSGGSEEVWDPKNYCPMILRAEDGIVVWRWFQVQSPSHSFLDGRAFAVLPSELPEYDRALLQLSDSLPMKPGGKRLKAAEISSRLTAAWDSFQRTGAMPSSPAN